jgi:hypothetical protein
MILARVSGLATVVLFLAKHRARPYYALPKRVREFYRERRDGGSARPFTLAK